MLNLDFFLKDIKVEEGLFGKSKRSSERRGRG
jgi:hypothetical protein